MDPELVWVTDDDVRAQIASLPSIKMVVSPSRSSRA